MKMGQNDTIFNFSYYNCYSIPSKLSAVELSDVSIFDILNT